MAEDHGDRRGRSGGRGRYRLKLESAARRNFERKHALDYQLGRTLEGLLGTEPLAESIARAEGLNSKLIDMLGALRSSPAVRAGVPLARKSGSDPHGEG